MHARPDRGAARLLELREDQSLQHRLLAIGER